MSTAVSSSRPVFREQNQLSDDLVPGPSGSDIYRLTADEEERARLDLQHNMFQTVLGSNFAAPAATALVADGNVKKAILDVGCGSGAWPIDMAKQFPHCRVHGIDLAPDLKRPTPPNCTFEVGDLNLGLERYSGAFDFVHGRLIFWGIKDYPALIHEIGKTLRPNGVIEIKEWVLQVHDSNKKPIDAETHPEASAWNRFLHACDKAAQARGGTADAAANLERWVREDGQFEDIHSVDIWAPIAPAFTSDIPDYELLNRVGSMIAQDIKGFLNTAKPLLAASGMPTEEVERLAAAVIEEGAAPKDQLWSRMICVWGRKKAL